MNGFRVEGDLAVTKCIQKTDRAAAFKEISQRNSGVLVVRLNNGRTFDHAVTILADESLIIDPEEIRVINLSTETFERCGGETAGRLRVKEVRVVKKGAERCRRRKRSTEVIVIDDDDDLAPRRIKQKNNPCCTVPSQNL